MVRLALDRRLEPPHRVARRARDPAGLRGADGDREDHLRLPERDVTAHHRGAEQRPRAKLRRVAPEAPRLVGREPEPLDREIADPGEPEAHVAAGPREEVEPLPDGELVRASAGERDRDRVERRRVRLDEETSAFTDGSLDPVEERAGVLGRGRRGRNAWREGGRGRNSTARHSERLYSPRI